MTGKLIYSRLSGLAGGQIYPVIAPQETEVPYVVYTLISSAPTDTKDGVSTVDVERWQLSLYHSTYTDLVDLCDDIRDQLDRYTGTLQGVTVDSVIFLDENDSYDFENERYIRILDYQFRILRNG